MAPSTLPPAEILLQILSYIPSSDRSTLHACLLSCRGFFPVASPKLYQTICFSSYNPSSPFYDAKPCPPAAHGPLARRRGITTKPVRSRKAKLLDNVRVLEVDGRKDGPFAGARAIVMPGVRTLRVDMSLSKALDRREEKRWVDGFAPQSNMFDNFTGLKPRTIVIKHLGFHESTDLLADLPVLALSNVTRLIYLVEYTLWDSDFFGRTYGPSHSMTSFGLHQWLDGLSDSPKSLTTVDIIFWTRAPGLHFSTPGNKYAYMSFQPGETWLDLFISHIAETFPSHNKIKFNFVNTGSFDRHSVQAAEWDYGSMEEAFREKLLDAVEQDEQKREKVEEVVRFMPVREWMEDMGRGGVEVEDVLTEEEMQPWLEAGSVDVKGR